jgi:hypothetical protein
VRPAQSLLKTQREQCCSCIGAVSVSSIQKFVTRADQPPGNLEFANDELRQMLELQDRLGWEAAFTGCWAQGWAKEQDDWCRFEHSGFAGKRWLTAIIKKLWDAAWDMWEHQNHVLHKQQQALLRQQEDMAIRAEHAVGFDHFPKHLRVHTRRSMFSMLSSKPEERSAWLTIIQGGRAQAETTAQKVRRQAELARQQRDVVINWLLGR